MKIRILPTIALASALGSFGFMAAGFANAQQNSGPRAEQRQSPQRGQPPRLSPEDRAAFIDARIAAARAGLKLTPQQDAMWPAVEQAARDGMNKMASMREQARGQQPPADPIERMRRMADAATARGDIMHKFVEAAQPLYASLTDDQKRRLPMLMRLSGAEGGGMRGQRFGDRAEPRQRQGYMGRDDGAGRYDNSRRDRRGPRDNSAPDDSRL